MNMMSFKAEIFFRMRQGVLVYEEMRIGVMVCDDGIPETRAKTWSKIMGCMWIAEYVKNGPQTSFINVCLENGSRM